MKKLVYLILVGLVVVSCKGSMKDGMNSSTDSIDIITDSIKVTDGINE